jgi:hypothetical protein
MNKGEDANQGDNIAVVRRLYEARGSPEILAQVRSIYSFQIIVGGFAFGWAGRKPGSGINS